LIIVLRVIYEASGKRDREDDEKKRKEKEKPILLYVHKK
jgi:hypothetical protein